MYVFDLFFKKFRHSLCIETIIYIMFFTKFWWIFWVMFSWLSKVISLKEQYRILLFSSELQVFLRLLSWVVLNEGGLYHFVSVLACNYFIFNIPHFFIFFILCFFSSVEFEEPWYYVYKAEMYRKEKSFDQALYQLQWLEILIFQYFRNNILTVSINNFFYSKFYI